jgi:hypothetical protein
VGGLADRAPFRRGHARIDPGLVATVVSRTPLRYGDGADAVSGRPAHVRAGSALAAVAGGLLVVQDDASFVAVIDAARARALPLPYAPGGARTFDEARGNKGLKLDLEAALALPDGRVVALGSGSRPVREQAVVIDSEARIARIVPLPRLYAALRECEGFAGAELNVEGAALLPGARVVRLFNRGNGAPTAERPAVDATVDLDLGTFAALLDAPDSVPCIALSNVARYDLGTLGGTRATFTDAAVRGERLYALVCAEASPNAYDDGPVAGAALGVFASAEPGAELRLAPLRRSDGATFVGKAEGLWLDPAEAGRAVVVLDPDDPDAPAELCELRLAGDW